MKIYLGKILFWRKLKLMTSIDFPIIVLTATYPYDRFIYELPYGTATYPYDRFMYDIP